MQIAYAGNFDPPHSTENEVRKALEHLGHDVWLCQEGQPDRWRELTDRVADFDVVLWTRTADLAKRIPHRDQIQLLLAARRADVPTCAFHLDRWWGLREHGREDSVWTEPFFRCEHFFSTDGAHDLEWATAGVNHHWMPPAVSEFECERGTPRDEWRSDIGFLGSWRHYHGEHTHRRELVEWLRATYGDRVRFFPEPGQPGIRGDDLRDLIASVKVWVGDSCLAPRADGGPMHSYVSDRVPEVIGRGGFLLHPLVPGSVEQCTSGKFDGTYWRPKVHLDAWPMGDFAALAERIDHYLASDQIRRNVAYNGMEFTKAFHTYTVRMREVLEAVCPS